jgi:hypothetical protein
MIVGAGRFSRAFGVRRVYTMISVPGKTAKASA